MKKLHLGIILFLLIANRTAFAQKSALGELSCIQSTCGDLSPFQHPFEISKKNELDINQLISSELKRPLQNYLGRIIHKSLLLDHAFNFLMQKNFSFDLSSDEKALIHSFVYYKRMNEFNPAVERTRDGDITFNRDLLKTILGAKSSDEQITAIISLRHIYFDQMTFANLAMRTSYEMLLKLRNQGKPVIEAQMIEAQSILDNQNKLNSRLPILKSIQADNLILKKALKGDTLTAAEQQVMVGRIGQNIALSGILDFEVQASFKNLKLDIAEFIINEKNRYQASESGQAFKSPIKVKMILESAVKECTNKLSYSYAALPTTEQLVSFKNMYHVIESQAQVLMEEKQKKSLPDAFKLEVFYPQAKEVAIADWKENLVSASIDTENAILNLKSLDLSDDATAKSLVIIFAIFRDEKLFSEVLNFCDKAKPPFLSDAASYRRKAVNLSWPTITHPETGLGILAHELGHVASAKWGQYFIDEMDCLQGKHYRTAMFTEEDFADMFSAQIINKVTGTVNGVKLKNPGCSTIGRDNSRWKLSGLDNSDATDTHSAGLYRTLAFAGMTNTLTPQCSSYLQSISEKRFEPFCNWEKDLKYKIYD